MKIAKNKRVRITRDLITALGFQWWNRWEFTQHLNKTYNLVPTCRRNGLYYFKPLDVSKLTLFLLTYGDYVK